MAVASFPVFPNFHATTEYRRDIVGNPGHQSGLKKGVRSLADQVLRKTDETREFYQRLLLMASSEVTI
jgi:hypothetical protein